jgi:hypothetical protein
MYIAPGSEVITHSAMQRTQILALPAKPAQHKRQPNGLPPSCKVPHNDIVGISVLRKTLSTS